MAGGFKKFHQEVTSDALFSPKRTYISEKDPNFKETRQKIKKKKEKVKSRK